LQILKKIKPIIYIPRESESRTLKKVFYEEFPNYYILWFYWPYDGILTDHEDYEPVIFIMKDDKLVDIGIRPHNRYDHSDFWVQEDSRPIIIFWTIWHGPIIDKDQGLMSVYKNPVVSMKITDYEIELGTPPNWFFSADAGKSVYDYAQELLAGA